MRRSKMKRKTLRERLKKKHYRDKMSIRSISRGLRDSFDRAYAVAVTSITSQIEEANNLNKVLTEKMNSIHFEEDTQPLAEDLKIFDEWGSNAWLIHSNEDSLLSLSEMRIIFIFKTIEKAIKEMVGIAFPIINKKDLFRWELLTSHLKCNGVEIKRLTGYQEINQLRIVNNNIKHSQEINGETKKILYWKHEDEFSFKNLETFYNNIEKTVMEFMEDLGEAIIASTYELTDEKLEEMSKEIIDRLDSKQVRKLITKLEAKL